MSTFLVFIFKSSVCLILFYLLYKLLLSKNTFHKANRILLICIYALALLLPFIEIRTAHPTEFHHAIAGWEHRVVVSSNVETAQVLHLEVAAEGANATEEAQHNMLTWSEIALIVYCMGIVLFISRSIYSLLRMYILLNKGKRQKLSGNAVLVTHNRNIAPFSWMNYIVISETDKKENGEAILAHEFAHIRLRHTFDLVLSEMFTFFLWFNPAAWLMKRELQNVHEYQADEKVLGSGIDAREYQLLLIKKAVGSQRFNSMTNSFNHSKLKNRITMMLKQKSSSWARLKYLCILPLTALSVAAFARSEVFLEMGELPVAEVTNLVSITEGYSANKQKETGDSIPAKKVQKSWNRNDIKADHPPLIIVDGKEVSFEQYEKEPPRKNSLEILEAEIAMKEYGDKGKYGAWIFYDKEEDAKDEEKKLVLSFPMEVVTGLTHNPKGENQIVNLKAEKINRETPDFMIRNDAFYIKDKDEHYVKVFSYENADKLVVILDGQQITPEELNKKRINVKQISLPSNHKSESKKELIVNIDTE